MKVHRNERGITGLETAIILLAFVAVALVLAFVALLNTTEENAAEETSTATETTITVTTEPPVSGSTTLFIFPPGP